MLSDSVCERENIGWEFCLPDLGMLKESDGFLELSETCDGMFRTGRNGVKRVVSTGDHKVEFVAFGDRTIAGVRSSMGSPAYYPVEPAGIERPIKAVLMDLDGTSVRSEEFWVWMIEMTTASMLGNPKFQLDESDLAHVSGHSVSEHLQYCIAKYCPEKNVEEARRFYFEHTEREMQLILEGGGRRDAFVPTPGLKDFLMELKARSIKIGLVTSGLHQKAWPEIVSAFEALDMGDPLDFYDAIITAGFPMRRGESAGTLGELAPKPHPWLYAETARVGLGMDADERAHVIGIEDSGAGVCSIRLAGFAPVGFAGGNIRESGTQGLCSHFAENFADIMGIIDNQN